MVKRRYASTAFDGEGARFNGGRWNSPGVAVVYCSSTRALAALEVLAGLGSTAPLNAYVVIAVSFDAALVETVELAVLPENWRDSPPGVSTQQVGDDWIDAGKTAVLSVPSVIVPEERNYLLNPTHPSFGDITRGPAEDFEFDSRLGG